MNTEYKNYIQWKGWGDPLEPEALERMAAYYSEVFKRASVRKGADVLELGFGDGHFLRWAKSLGFKVSGLEIIPDLVELIKEEDFAADCGSLSGRADSIADGSIDAIVAFDVFEHMDPDEFRATLAVARKILKPNGCVIARVPNAGSPFGQLLQNGDPTHRIAFTISSLSQFCVDAGIRLEWGGNSIRVMAGANSKWKRRAAYLFRDCLERLLGFAYYGRRVPLDPTITIILRKEDLEE